ncbi:MAG: restriction endonuclease subunit S, partial [Nanoarchaeota archaeon]|nr:restriction endonuclease subunit S [Nanoarchaeota archaeon]
MDFNTEIKVVKLSDIATVKGRIGWKALKKEEYVEDGYPILTSYNLNDSFYGLDFITKINKVPKWRYDESPEIKVCKNDILMSKIEGRVGFVNNLEVESTINSSLTVIRVKDENMILPKYLFYYFKSPKFQEYFLNNKKGTTMGAITQVSLKSYDIVIPSLEKQQEIIDILEENLTKVISTIDSLGLTSKKLKLYRQSILNSAYNGSLTNVQILKNVQIKEVLENVRYGTSKKCYYDIKGTPVLRIPNIVKGFIDDSDLKYANLEEKEFEGLKLIEGDILVIRSNGSKNLVGRSAIVTKEHKDYCYAGYLIRLRFNNEILPNFFNYYFQSGFIRNQIENKSKSTSGVNNINAQEISSMRINLFSLEEQQQIVEEIESRFSVIE